MPYCWGRNDTGDMYASQSGKPDVQKDKFYNEMIHEWVIKGRKELTLGSGDFNGDVGKKIDGFEGVHVGNENWGAKFGR